MYPWTCSIMATQTLIIVIFSIIRVGNSDTIQTSACISNYVDLLFPKRNASDVTAIVWRKRSGDSNVPVASFQKSFKGIAKFKNRVELIANNNIQIRNISKSDEGEYTRHIHNGGSFVDNVELFVYEPPQGLPIIDQYRNHDGTITLTCKNSQNMSLGSPSIGLVMKDSNGRIQDLTLTLNDKFYQCCMIGIALTCLEAGDETCVYFITPDVYREASSCKDSIKCILVSFLYWILGIIVLKVTAICTLYFSGSKDSIFARRWILFAIQIIFSAAIFFIVSVPLCIELEDCHKRVYHILFGLGSAFTIVIPFSFSAVFSRHQDVLTQRKNISPRHHGIGRWKSMLELIQHPLFRFCSKPKTDNEHTRKLLGSSTPKWTVDLSDIDCSKNRKYARRFKRVEILKKGLKHKLLNYDKKAEINRILTPDYMSSEESEYEDDENKTNTKLVAYKVRKLPWLHEKVGILKDSLIQTYNIYEKKPSYDDDDDKVERIDSEKISERQAPGNMPDWAQKGNEHPFLGFLSQ